MKGLIGLFVMAAAVSLSEVTGQSCSAVAGAYDNIPFCTTCVNDPLQCKDCSWGRTLIGDKTACIECPSNCAICDFESATDTVPMCKNCTAGHYLEAGLCKPCITPFCRVCEKPAGVIETCLDCYGSYILDSLLGFTFCQLCPTNCKTCSLAEVLTVNKPTCDSCNSGYYKKKVTASEPVYGCSACASTCESCTDNGSGGSKCTKCRAGYALNQETGTCVVCPSNCVKCDYDTTLTTTVCTQCVSDRFQLIFGVCSVCTGNCAVCSSDIGVCSECDPYHRRDGGGCTACDTNCIECDDTKCLTCAPMYATKGADDRSCDVCSSNCNTCNQNGCLICQIGYRLDLFQRSCIKCPTGCTSCSSTSCTGCESNYVLHSGTCYSCPPTGCSTSTCSYDTFLLTTVCTFCASGYVRNTNTETCDACPDNCGVGGGDCSYNNTLVLGRTTICTACVAYFEASATDGLCKDCPPHCTACIWNSTINAMDCAGPSCANSDNATVYIADTVSADIVAGVAIVAGQDYCKECSLGCQTCDAALFCSACFSGYTRDTVNGVCLPCTDYCATGCALNTTGTDVVNCASCVAGYGIGSLLTTCYACNTVAGPGCASCTYTNQWVCNSCESGYAYDAVAQSCGACASHCLSCNVAGECTVGQCELDYAHRSEDNRCYKCPAIINDNNCWTCGYSGSSVSTVPDVCNTCVGGYTLADDSTCQICPDHCNWCTYDTTLARTKCNILSCEAGYARNADEGTCHVCPTNCGLCTWDDVRLYTVCSICGTSFFTNDQVCSACPPNCLTCEVSNGVNLCSACRIGFALDDGFCRACISNCAECSAVDTCSVCKTGYGKTSDSKACTGCAALTEVDGCTRCNDQEGSKPAGCLDCSFGSTLADHALECLDNSLVTDCLTTWDPPPKCTTCNAGYNTTSNGFCGTSCNVCGSPNDMKLEEECNAAGINYTSIECVGHDKCVMIWKKDTSVYGNLPTVARGCFANVTCTEDEFDKAKTCYENKNAKVKECKKCCRGANCNDYVFQGQAAITSSLALVVAAILSTLTLRLTV